MACGRSVLRNFWALPAILRLVICDHAAFSVHNDLLAFPQYEVIYSSSYISGSDAEALLALPKPSSAPTTQDVHLGEHDSIPTADLSIHQDSDAHQQDEPLNGRPSLYDRSFDKHERLILRKRPYLCTIPYVAPPSPSTPRENNSSQSAEDEHKAELARATLQGVELLKDMQGQCIYYNAGWWVYAFCYNEFVKQFHPLAPGRGVPPFPPTEDTDVGSYLLGRFPDGKAQGAHPSESATLGEDTSTAVASSLQTAGSTSFLVQRLDGGTSCDLTGHARRIEVQFHCNPASPDRIHMIKETSSCVYLMVIHTARLCNDVAFMPPQTEKPHAIACREILSTAEDEADWRMRTEAEARSAMRAAAEQQDALKNDILGAVAGNLQPKRPLIIGGVTVGAQSLVGSTPELTISASSIIGSTSPQQNVRGQGQKEEFLATLARSDGRYTSSLSEPEMKKLGLKGTREELTKWIGQMQAQAGEGVPWRLDVVRVDGGVFEFRGILGAEDAADEAKIREKKAAKAKEAAKQQTARPAVPQQVSQLVRTKIDSQEEEAEFAGEEYEYGPEEGEDDAPSDGTGEGSQEEFR